jgi:hypothetical protein
MVNGEWWILNDYKMLNSKNKGDEREESRE